MEEVRTKTLSLDELKLSYDKTLEYLENFHDLLCTLRTQIREIKKFYSSDVSKRFKSIRIIPKSFKGKFDYLYSELSELSEKLKEDVLVDSEDVKVVKNLLDDLIGELEYIIKKLKKE